MLLIMLGKVENVANVAGNSNTSRPVSIAFAPFANSTDVDRQVVANLSYLIRAP